MGNFYRKKAKSSKAGSAPERIFTQAEIAENYAVSGIPVFPCGFDKSPLVKNGFKDATTDIKTVRQWWRRNPQAMVATPNTSFTVIDVDNGEGKICDSGQALTAAALGRLYSDVLDVTKLFTVKTQSGGLHFYFKKTPEATRKINILPNIDLLGDGGYVILPDNKNYSCRSKEPWKTLTEALPVLNLDAFNRLAEDMREASVIAKRLKKEYKQFLLHGDAALFKEKTDELVEVESGVLVPKDRKSEKPAYVGETIAYGDVPSYEQTPNMYKRNENYETDESLVAAFVEACDSNMPVIGWRGMFTSQRINALFHTPEIQIRLGKMLGLKIPDMKSTAKSVSIHSVFPDHSDRNKSMSVRWNKDKTHLLVHDFANHYHDALEQLDYNLVRLYVTIRSRTQAGRLNKPEFLVWFLRMLEEAGLLDTTGMRKRAELNLGLPPCQRHALQGMIHLDALKQCYSGYDHNTLFTDRFGAAWLGMRPATVNACKKYLVDEGCLALAGVSNKGKKTTTVYRIADKECLAIIREKDVNKRQKLALRRKGMKHTKIDEAVEQPKTGAESEIAGAASQQPGDGALPTTLFGIRVSQKTYDTVMNFCKDNKIEAVPFRRNMFVPLCLIDDFVMEDAPKRDFAAYLMTELYLEVVEPTTPGQGKLLMLSGHCPPMDEAFEKFAEKYEEYDLVFDEPTIGVVISHDYKGSEEVAVLEQKLTEYLQGVAVFDEEFTRHATRDEMFKFIIDGKEPA